MSRRAARFTEADAVRAAKAAKRTGMAVEFRPDGVIRLVPFEATGEILTPLAPLPGPTSPKEDYVF